MIPEKEVIHEFSNIGHNSGGRNFAGFAALSSSPVRELDPRAAQRLELSAGDLFQIDVTRHAGRVALLAFGHRGERREAAIGLGALHPLNLGAFESASLLGWITAKGGEADTLSAIILDTMDEPLILRVSEPLTLWLAHLQERGGLVSGNAAGPVKYWHQAAEGRFVLPDPLGHIREEFTVGRGTARAYELHAGDYVQIIDAEGQQCSDFQALRLRSLEKGQEWAIDSTATRSMVRRAYPGPGLLDKFFDAEMRPLFRVVQDTCGRHDTFGLACTARGYEERGYPGHLNCSDNISEALAPFGVARRSAWPAINFFWNTWMDAHHQIQTEESHSRPGDYVALQAMDDMACVTTACPDDIDPINGWNPTDIHVRIYSPETRIQRAVGYRKKEDAAMKISQHSAFHPRLSALTEHFAPARDLWAAVSFPADGSIGEYWACREAATLQDMSSLRKVDVIGPDAERLLQNAMTRDIARLAQWRGTYSLMCDSSGEVIDDGTLFRLGPQLYRWCCGTEESARWLEKLAKDGGFQVRIHDLGGSLPNLALQGPKSRDILRKVVFTQPHVPALDQLKWFGVTIARLHTREGSPFMLARSGYTGELGYEIFCAQSDALDIWDALSEAGAEHGMKPMGTEALDMIRIEAGLASASEFAPGHDALEAGLGFAVDMRKQDFIGKSALARNATAPRRVMRGLLLNCDDVPASGAPVFADERQVGIVTSATRSPMFERAIAMARLTVEHAEPGVQLEVGQLDGRMKRLSATVTTIPFYDPKRERARA